jgi:uncharacterized protein
MNNDSMTVTVVVAMVSFFTAIIDTIFGMGFGLTMTPILIFAGFDPHQIVPALLFSSLAGNILSPIFNHRLKNVNFNIGSKQFKIALVVGSIGIVGSYIGATAAIGITSFYLTLYIGVIITGTGLFLLFNKKSIILFSWVKLTIISLFGSFNKGISGSGFGPIVTTGLLLMQTDEKAAVSIQGFSELFVSLAGGLTFVFSGVEMNWQLTLALMSGVVLSTPLAAFIVKRANNKKLRSAIGYVTVILGIIMLVKLM